MPRLITFIDHIFTGAYTSSFFPSFFLKKEAYEGMFFLLKVLYFLLFYRNEGKRTAFFFICLYFFFIKDILEYVSTFFLYFLLKFENMSFLPKFFFLKILWALGFNGAYFLGPVISLYIYSGVWNKCTVWNKCMGGKIR